jgi:ZIP family zinc transporter
MQLRVPFALLLSMMAGFSTWIGSIIAFFMYRPRRWLLSLILGFSAGVMVYISFAELLKTAIDQIGLTNANLGFFTGIILIALTDLVIPHEYKAERVEDSPIASSLDISASKELGRRGFRWGAPEASPGRKGGRQQPDLLRAGILTALGIAIHNFPEGLIVFSSAVGGDVKHGIVVAVAVALHNIPEGISVSLPVLAATGSRKRAFMYSFSAGVAEPIGAILGFLVLRPFLTPFVLSLLLAFAAGIMVYISLDELLPAAHEYGASHIAITGIGVGMLVMAVSLILLD